ncbi:MAG TPA: alpha/beta hydrolase [Nitrospira sp.]|nr:alpha/beta hydrolase [Nitrospira sp.]
MQNNFLGSLARIRLIHALPAAAAMLMLLSSGSATAGQSSTEVTEATPTYSANSPLGELVDNPSTLAILQKFVPEVVNNPLYLASRTISLQVVQRLSKGMISADEVKLADVKLRTVPEIKIERPLNGAADDFLEIRTFRLWSGPAPLSSSLDDQPTLTVMPAEGAPTGTAVIIAPGGAYLGVAAGLEGREVADWFAARGVTAFVLKYRVGRNNPMPVPLLDAQRAVRLVRSRAREYGIAPDRIGIMGFSAGGHLAALEATLGEAGNPNSTDVVDRADSRPNFVVLGYPALNMFSPAEKTIPYCRLMAIESECDSAWYARYRPEDHVDAKTPPMFIYHTTTDELVPVGGSIGFYRLLTQSHVPAELHVFGTGRHGSGLGKGDPELDQWPALLEAWLRDNGWLSPYTFPSSKK